MPKDNPETVETDAAETGPKTVTFPWNGQEWTIPAKGDDWPYEAVEALEQGRMVTFVRHLLGPDQMRQFARGTRTTAGDAAELGNAAMDAAGGKSAGE